MTPSARGVSWVGLRGPWRSGLDAAGHVSGVDGALGLVGLDREAFPHLLALDPSSMQ